MKLGCFMSNLCKKNGFGIKRLLLNECFFLDVLN